MPEFEVDFIVRGLLPVQEYSIVAKKVAEKLDTVELNPTLGAATYLGAVGMPGLSAYSSFYSIGKPKRGETIFISSAAGAVGQLVGQLAKREGMKVIGSVGSQEKLDFIINELDFDAGFNYKVEATQKALERLAPEGIDLYFDNVGGEQLEGALANMKTFGRISKCLLACHLSHPFHGCKLLKMARKVACGMISQYEKPEKEIYKVKNLMQIVTLRLKVEGFVWSDPHMGPKHAIEHRNNVEQWLLDGSLKAPLHIVAGIERGPEELASFLRGNVFGKSLLAL
jgi:NADPH-dependent curcumin reductase CurA